MVLPMPRDAPVTRALFPRSVTMRAPCPVRPRPFLGGPRVAERGERRRPRDHLIECRLQRVKLMLARLEDAEVLEIREQRQGDLAARTSNSAFQRAGPR